MDAVIRHEQVGDSDAIERVCAAAFGPGRHAKVSARVREFARLNRALSAVAVAGGAVVGCCRIFEIAIGDAPALFLGPLAVDPAAQASGLGKRLVDAAVEACATRRAALLVVGQPRLFEKFGFVHVPKGQVTMPGPVEARRFLWRACGGAALESVSGAVSPPRAAN